MCMVAFEFVSVSLSENMFLVRHISGLCLYVPINEEKIKVSTKCTSLFTLSPEGCLHHNQSGKYVQLEVDARLGDTCRNKDVILKTAKSIITRKIDDDCVTINGIPAYPGVPSLGAQVKMDSTCNQIFFFESG